MATRHSKKATTLEHAGWWEYVGDPGEALIPPDARNKIYLIENLTDAPLPVRYKEGGGKIVSIQPGEKRHVFVDGTNIEDLFKPSYELTDAERVFGLLFVDTRYEVGNVLRYGADPTGTSESTEAFTIACNVSPRVFIPAGEYLVANVQIPAAIIIQGESWRRSIIRPVASGTTALFEIRGTGFPTGAKAFCKLQDLMFFNGGVATECRAIVAEFFDQLYLEQLIVDGFHDNITLLNGAFVYGINVRSWSATFRCLVADCNGIGIESNVGLWLSFIHSEFVGSSGPFNATVFDWATVRFIKCEFDSGTTGLLVKQNYTTTLADVGDVIVWGCGFDTCKGIGLILDTVRAFTVSQNWVSSGRDNVTEGCNISACRAGSIVDNDFANCGDTGLQITNSEEIHVRGNRCYANGQSGSGVRAGMRLTNSHYCTIQGNHCINFNFGFANLNQQVGITTDGISDNNIITHNILRGNVQSQLAFVGANNIIEGNKGFVSENRGVFNINSTAASVTHGLGFAPTLAQIRLTPASSLGNATKFWASSPDGISFTINLDQNPGSPVAFSWEIRHS